MTINKIGTSLTDKVSVGIVVLCIALIIFVLSSDTPSGGYTPLSVISLIGSIASTGGLIIAIIQIVALKKTSEATQQAIFKTEQELSVMRAIESASNCFNQLNQIDEYLETLNIDSIKTLLPIATQNFHELIYFTGHDLEKVIKEQEELSDFLESFASKLTIMANHKNTKQIPYELGDDELNDISFKLQQTKAYTNIYRNTLQQAIVKDRNF